MGMCRVIESYLIRRAVLDLTTKNYNRLFLQVAERAAAVRVHKPRTGKATWCGKRGYRLAER